MELWRLLDSGPANGFRNMAVDVAMAQLAADQPFAATLRLYGWQPAAVSLGYHQPLHDIDLEACQRDHLDVVYRPTGGRAVLHSDELTYAVVLGPSSRLFKAEIMTVYEQLSQAILAGLALLQISAQFDRSERALKNFSRGELSGLCYASANRHEIGVEGKKMIGSAQRRMDQAVLQHGSILIGPQHCDLAFYLANRADDRRQAVHRYMKEHTVCLNEISPRPITYTEFSAALAEGFRRTLDLEWIKTPLTAVEEERAQELERQARLNIQERRERG